VNKRHHSGSYLATLALSLGLMSGGTLLHAQQPSPDAQPPAQTQPSPDSQTSPSQTPPPDTQTQSPSQTSPDQTGQPTPSQTQPGQPQPDATGKQTPSDSQAQSSDPSAAGQTFVGTVVKQGGKYMLQDESGTTYDIDHQDQVQKYEGKKIRVHGTLDASGKMIHVQ
jgi:outer membrane biosynthesis protein TonB